MSPPRESATLTDALSAFKQEAFDTFLGVEFWYRRQYNLAPTDERYLNATREEMLVELLRYVFFARYQEAQKEGRPTETIDDLLIEEAFDRQLEELDEQLETEPSTQPQTSQRPADNPNDREVMFDLSTWRKSR